MSRCRVHAACDWSDHVKREAAQLGRVAHARQRMIVGNKIIGVVVRLQVDKLLERAKIVTNMQSARRLNSRQDSHGRSTSVQSLAAPERRSHDTRVWHSRGQTTVPSRFRCVQVTEPPGNQRQFNRQEAKSAKIAGNGESVPEVGRRLSLRFDQGDWCCRPRPRRGLTNEPRATP